MLALRLRYSSASSIFLASLLNATSIIASLIDNGNLLKYVSEETEVSYEVTIEYSGKKLTKTYTTTVFPK